MVVLGLDWGQSRIGAAVSDELGIAAHFADTIERDGQELDRIADLVRQRGVERIVVGMPLRMDGTDGVQARKVRGFMKRLRKCLPDVAVEEQDERLTSAQAHRALSEMEASMRRRRADVDGMAAQIILQRYLDRHAADRRPEG